MLKDIREKLTGKGVLLEETLQALDALGEVLLRIRKRMLSEGFDVVDGKVVKRSILEKRLT